MKKVLLLNFVAALIFTNNINAQDGNPVSSKRQIFISEGYIGFGGYANRGFVNSSSYFESLAPNATLSPEGLKSNSDRHYYNYNGSGVVNLTLGIGFRDKDSKDNVSNKTLRVGFIHTSSSSFDGTWYNEERYPYDTLVSKVTGNKYPVDSVYSEYLDFQYVYKQLGLDVSFIIRSSSKPRFSVYAGIGASASISYSARTDIYYSERSSLSEVEFFGSSYNSPYHYFDNNDDGKHETFKNKTNYSTNVYAPIGLDFRFGNKGEIWKMIHLYYEMRPGMSFLYVPEIGNLTTATIGHNIGFRFTFNG